MGLFDYLTEEVLLQILVKLPIKSVVKCMCVCKTWYSLIKSPIFISTHLSKTVSSSGASSNPLVLVRHCTHDDDGEILEEDYSLHLDNNEMELYMQLRLPFQAWHPRLNFNVVSTCNGVVCLMTVTVYCMFSIILWNPLIHKWMHLPLPSNPVLENYRSSCFGFGYDSCAKDYKVIRIGRTFEGLGTDCIDCELYSLKASSWRTIPSILHLAGLWADESSVLPFVNGFFHFIGIRFTNDGDTVGKLFNFDVSREVFQEIKLPDFLASVVSDSCLTLYRDSSIALNQSVRYGYQIWVMREYGVQDSWTKLCVVARDYPCFYNVLAFRKNGEVLLGDEDEGNILSYRPSSTESSKIWNKNVNLDFFFCGSYVESLVLLDYGK